PAALRSHADPVVTTVVSITGETTGGTETFLAGDPIIGQPVNLGPDTYLAGNNNSSDTPGSPAPEEYYQARLEPMALFEFNLGTGFAPPSLYLKGKSQVGPFTHKAGFVNERTRMPDSRPIAAGLVAATPADLAVFSLPDQQTFSETRIDQLVTDYL